MAETWTYRVEIEGVIVDSCSVFRPLTIEHGRSSAIVQPDAPTCEFSWLGSDPPGQLGDDVRVLLTLSTTAPTWIYDAPANYTYDSADYLYDNVTTFDAGPRFTGRIVGITALESLGDVVEWQVQCIGTQATYAGIQVNITRPSETDIARVTAIATAAGATLTIHGTSTLTLAADQVEQDALAAWHEVCASSGGLVWQAVDGSMHYGTANHRQGTDPAGVLPCDTILDGLEWVENVESVLNHITVRWGPEGSQSENTHSDAPSILKWGQRHVDISTMAAAQADADQLGLLVLARRSEPYWTMPGVMTEASLASLPEQRVLAALEVGSIVLVPVEAEPSPAPGGLTNWLVEGWVEEAGEDGVARIQLALADAARWATTRLRTWQEAKAATWASEATGSWLDALVMEGTE